MRTWTYQARAAMLVWSLAFAGPAAASEYPTSPVTFVVGFPPGTSTDTIARIVGEKLGSYWQQPVIVENKPGVGGSLAAAQVSRAKPDGQTLLLSATAPMNINPFVYADLKYDPLNDFEAIGQTTWLPYLLVTNKKKGLDTFDKLISHAKANPDSLTFASIGVGTTSHLLMAMLMNKTGTSMVHIPYKGSSQAQTDVIGGNVDMTFDTLVSTAPHIKDGKLQALALSTDKRAALAPDVPTIQESGVADFNVGAWLGFFAPKGTPENVLEKIHTDLNRALQDPAVRERLEALGSEVVISPTRADFKQMVEKNYHLWGDTAKAVGVAQK